MNTLAIIVDTTEDRSILNFFSQHNNTISNTSKIIILFVAKDRWFSFNEPRSILASLETRNHSEGVDRKNIINYLSEIEKSLRAINKSVEIVKIVVFGTEKYKVGKCLRLLKVEMCMVKTRKRSILQKLITKSMHEFINQDLKIPVILL
ncbi:hypothetical protein NGRA_1811 [Nosema granulosis]|uniref:Uncharacterized protein n=1 Tax=Nosema granulosis TaxID=83296 RepID=A0A9P6KZ10_9MICR|nr:hypothetical protein NGRA_1811 [Nosema granulosis]